MRMYPRSEFPTERLPSIINAKGSPMRAAIRQRFSAVGCPHGNVEVVVAAIKSGVEPVFAFQLGMLAHAANDLSEHCTERYTSAILDVVRRKHAQKYPRGKCAEDLAALHEGRPSRWGTPEFHREASAQ